jgi:hypothetical protein
MFWIFKSDGIIDARLINPETFFRPLFDIENIFSQGIFIFLIGTDPTLETLAKERLYFFLLLEKVQDGFIPGQLRDTPFNLLDPGDFTMSRDASTICLMVAVHKQVFGVDHSTRQHC